LDLCKSSVSDMCLSRSIQLEHIGRSAPGIKGGITRPLSFIRRFMLHVLPKGFHRIRHYGLLASCRTKAATLVRARDLIAAATPSAKMQGDDEAAASIEQPAHPCPCCGARMVITRQAACRATGRPSGNSRSGSTRHDADRHHLARHCRSVVLPARRSRRSRLASMRIKRTQRPLLRPRGPVHNARFGDHLPVWPFSPQRPPSPPAPAAPVAPAKSP
jgi:hypothetical protein